MWGFSKPYLITFLGRYSDIYVDDLCKGLICLIDNEDPWMPCFVGQRVSSLIDQGIFKELGPYGTAKSTEPAMPSHKMVSARSAPFRLPMQVAPRRKTCGKGFTVQ